MKNRVVSLLILILAVILTAGQPSAQTKSMDKLKKEKQATTKVIKETTGKLKATAAETKRQLNRLESLRSEVIEQKKIADKARRDVDSVNVAIAQMNDTIAALEQQLAHLRDAYGKSLRKLQVLNRPSSMLSYVFAAESFEQAYRRVRYLRQFSVWRKRKAHQLEEARQEIDSRKAVLTTMAGERNHALRQLHAAGNALKLKQNETETIVASLKKEESSLRGVLKEQEQKRKKLDNQIEKLIQQEQERQEKLRKEKARKEAEAREKARKEAEARKAAQEKAAREKAEREKASAENKPVKPKSEPTKPVKPEPTKPKPEIQQPDPDRELTGSFTANKGRLLFPVASQYKIVKGFGRQPHPELKHVMTENSGIDIEVPSGGAVRSIYEGTVSAIFRQSGFNTIVMIRHGEYLSIYAGLGTISVKTGQKLKAGQTIGTIAKDPDQDNRYILHFEIRKERQKLNPTLWVR